MLNPDQFCDCIGEESSVDLKPDVTLPLPRPGGTRKISHRRRRTEAEKEKEYPPPIHMTYVMKKYYTDDGRLIIKEEKAKRQDYLEAYRCNGRLVLNLVPVEEDEDYKDDDKEDDKKEERIEGGDEEEGEKDDDDDDPTVENGVYSYSTTRYSGGIGGLRKPCGGYRLAVEAFTSPVHTL